LALECRDIETALYDRPSSVRTSLANIVFNISVHHKAVVAHTAAEAENWLWLLMNILTRTMNTLSGLWILSITKLHTRLQSVS